MPKRNVCPPATGTHKRNAFLVLEQKHHIFEQFYHDNATEFCWRFLLGFSRFQFCKDASQGFTTRKQYASQLQEQRQQQEAAWLEGRQDKADHRNNNKSKSVVLNNNDSKSNNNDMGNKASFSIKQ